MNLGQLIRRSGRWFGERPALRSPEGTYSFAFLDRRSDLLAAALRSLGLQAGDRVAVVMENRQECVEIDFSLYKLGLVKVGINPLLGSADLLALAADADLNAIFFSASAAGRVELLPDRFSEMIAIALDDTDAGEAHRYEALLAAAERGDFGQPPTDEELAQAAGDDSAATLFYTGGTTGTPKGAMFSHGKLLQTLMDYQADMYRLTPRDVVLSTGSLALSGGFRVLLTFFYGSEHLIVAAAKAPELLDTIAKYRVTVISTVPTLLARLVEEQETEPRDVTSLRVINFGAAPPPLAIVKRARRCFGPVMWQQYGLTEAPITVAHLPPWDLDELLSRDPKELPAGRAFVAVQVKTVSDDGQSLPPGDVGEVLVATPHLMQGYWRRPEESGAALRDGWLYTGDLGYLDSEGYLYLVGRKKEVIKSGGFSVYPREIEEHLHTHPGIRQAAVVGLPDEQWGEMVVAAVVLVPGHSLTADAVKAYCRAQLASFKQPKRVLFVTDLPLTSAGKLDRRTLAAQLN